MFTHGFDPMMQYKQRHNELMAEARNYRLVKEAEAARKANSQPEPNIMALVGKWLVAVGTRLEQRYTMQPYGEAAGNQSGLNILL